MNIIFGILLAPFIYLAWLSSDSETKKSSFRDVWEGMKPHKCRFTVPEKGYEEDWRHCEHRGCNYACQIKHLDANGYEDKSTYSHNQNK